MKKQTREELRRARQRRRRTRGTIFAVVSVLVLGTAGYLLVKAFWRPELPPMAANVIDIAADMGGFNRKTVRVRAGEPVTVRLTSLDNSHHTDGGGRHQWAVDELGVDIVAPDARPPGALEPAPQGVGAAGAGWRSGGDGPAHPRNSLTRIAPTRKETLWQPIQSAA